MSIAIERPTQLKPITFDEFLIQYSDDDRYELIDGEIFDLEPTGSHEEIAAFIDSFACTIGDRKLNVQIDNYFVRSSLLVHFVFHELTGNRPIVNRCPRRRSQPDRLRQLLVTTQYISSPALKPMFQHIT
jgi:hypothetical protein